MEAVVCGEVSAMDIFSSSSLAKRCLSLALTLGVRDAARRGISQFNLGLPAACQHPSVALAPVPSLLWAIVPGPSGQQGLPSYSRYPAWLYPSFGLQWVRQFYF